MPCRLIATIGFVLRLVPGLALWRVMMQRITETAIFGWIGVISFNAWELGECMNDTMLRAYRPGDFRRRQLPKVAAKSKEQRIADSFRLRPD